MSEFRYDIDWGAVCTLCDKLCDKMNKKLYYVLEKLFTSIASHGYRYLPLLT
jgi:hypothetical protein